MFGAGSEKNWMVKDLLGRLLGRLLSLPSISVVVAESCRSPPDSVVGRAGDEHAVEIAPKAQVAVRGRE